MKNDSKQWAAQKVRELLVRSLMALARQMEALALEQGARK